MVLEQLRGHLRSPDVVRDVLPQAQKYDPTLDEAIVTVAMKRLDDVWDQLFPAEQMRIVLAGSPGDCLAQQHVDGFASHGYPATGA
jgi:hypothetical protein